MDDCHHIKIRRPNFPTSPPASGGEGWGEGGDIWREGIYEIPYFVLFVLPVSP